jgi:dienelactone hydrolase
MGASRVVSSNSAGGKWIPALSCRHEQHDATFWSATIHCRFHRRELIRGTNRAAMNRRTPDKDAICGMKQLLTGYCISSCESKNNMDSLFRGNDKNMNVVYWRKFQNMIFRQRLLIAVLSLSLLPALCFPITPRADNGEYFKEVFVPPAREELQQVWDATRYEPACKDFSIGETFKELKNGSLHYVTYTSDGYAQTGLYGKPGGKGPFRVLIFNHFGFSGITGTEISDAEDFINHGYIVAMATYRGEFGLAGKAEGPVDVLGDEVHDVLNLMECAAKDPDADPDKIVMMGVSHGGGLTLSALGHTNRIKAAATMAAPLNITGKPIQQLVRSWIKQPSKTEVLLSVLVSDEGLAKLKSILGLNERDLSKVVENRKELIRRSPALFAYKISVPVIMYLGDQDPVSFPEDAMAVEASLKTRGIFSRVTVFKNQSHGILPESGAAAKKEIMELFDRVLKGESLDGFMADKKTAVKI